MQTMFVCPVCHFEGLTVAPYETWPPPPGATLDPPYEDALGHPSYEVCPLCEFEFGNDDNPGTAAPQSFDEYRREWQSSGRVLVIEGPEGAIRFDPLAPDRREATSDAGFDFITSDVFVSAGTRHWHLSGRNGIEPAALAHLSGDLRTLVANRDGVVFFGDHDYSQLISFTWDTDAIDLRSDLPAEDAWDVALGRIPPDAIAGITDQIEAIERALGPLTGYCAGCGEPSSAWYPSNPK